MIKNIKICGIKFSLSIFSIELLTNTPTFFIGVIFYNHSYRFIGSIVPIETPIKKVGVFVNNSIENILKTVKKYSLELIQLHGHENIEFCEKLYKNNISIIKVFKIKTSLSLDQQKYIRYNIVYFFFIYLIPNV